MALLQRLHSNPQSKPAIPEPPATPTTRSRNQLAIFLAGASLLTLSSLLTHRSLTLRHRSTFPHFYHPSNQQPLLKINGRLEAYKALGVATMNVASFFIMMGGGLLWAFDIGSVEEFRRRVGGRRGVDGRWRERGERGAEEDEVEFEKWVASLTGRKTGEEKKAERRWDARESEKQERYAVVEPQAGDKKGKPR